MIATVMYRNSFFGGDGWKYHPVKIQIGDFCPVCNHPRGKTRPYTFYEDGDTFTVDTWENDCGHVDLYKDCLIEAGIDLKLAPVYCKTPSPSQDRKEDDILTAIADLPQEIEEDLIIQAIPSDNDLIAAHHLTTLLDAHYRMEKDPELFSKDNAIKQNYYGIYNRVKELIREGLIYEQDKG